MKKLFKIIIISILFLATVVCGLFLYAKNFNQKNNIKQTKQEQTVNIQIIKDEDIKEENINEINMLFVGDIMFGRHIEVLSKDNTNYPFEKIKDLFSEKNDIIYGNLEGPIMDPHYKTKNGSTVFSFPKYSVDVLKNNKFNLVSLANNHMQDYGKKGYSQVQNFLAENNINYFGDYYNTENLYFKKNINGKDFIFFGFNMINYDFEKNLDENKKNILDEIKKIRLENPNAFIISFPHWGNEYKIKSNKIQQDFAHELINNGVDLIIASHPHVTEEYEIYKNKYIFYSLGNFIFDQYFSIETQEMIGIKLKITCKEINDCENKIEIIPIKSINSQPQIITDEKEKEDFLKKYNLIK